VNECAWCGIEQDEDAPEVCSSCFVRHVLDLRTEKEPPCACAPVVDRVFQ
jgi:hypothetical protein